MVEVFPCTVGAKRQECLWEPGPHVDVVADRWRHARAQSTNLDDELLFLAGQ